MVKKKKILKQKIVKTGLEKGKTDSPVLQKFALLLFGLGPIILVCLFLYSQGFFDPI